MNLKFKTHFAKCKLLTIGKGKIQGVLDSIAFIEFCEKFSNKEFYTIDAKAFISAVASLDDFTIIEKDLYIILVDESKQVELIKQPKTLALNIPKSWHNCNITQPWNLAMNFISLDYPGLRINENYLEVLSNSYLVRVNVNLSGILDEKYFNRIVPSYKLPKDNLAICFTNTALWLAYDTGYIALNYLALILPNTDNFFKSNNYQYKIIPQKLKELKPIKTEFVEFKNNNLEFKTENIVTSTIENVEGLDGKYCFNIFDKIVKNSDVWITDKKALHFASAKLKGLLEKESNAEHTEF